MPSLSDFVGPRVPPAELRRHWGRYALPVGWFHRRVFKPLVEQYRRERAAATPAQAQAA